MKNFQFFLAFHIIRKQIFIVFFKPTNGETIMYVVSVFDGIIEYFTSETLQNNPS